MRSDKKVISAPPAEGSLGQVLTKTRRRFLASRPTQKRTQSLEPSSCATGVARPLALARGIAGKRRRHLGAGTLDFVSSCIGDKFGASQTRGLGGERSYRQPGQFFRNTVYNSVTELCMSLNFNQLARGVQILLNQIHTTQIFASAGNTETHSRAHTILGEGGRLPEATNLLPPPNLLPPTNLLPQTNLLSLPNWPEAPLLPPALAWTARTFATPSLGTVQRLETLRSLPAMRASDPRPWPASLQWPERMRLLLAMRRSESNTWLTTMQGPQGTLQSLAARRSESMQVRQLVQLPGLMQGAGSMLVQLSMPVPESLQIPMAMQFPQFMRRTQTMPGTQGTRLPRSMRRFGAAQFPQTTSWPQSLRWMEGTRRLQEQRLASTEFSQMTRWSQSLLWSDGVPLLQTMRGSALPRLSPATRDAALTQFSGTAESPAATQWLQTLQPTMHVQLALLQSRTVQLAQAAQRLQALHAPRTILSPRALSLPRALRSQMTSQSLRFSQALLLRPVSRSSREVVIHLPPLQTERPGEAETRPADRLFTLTKLERWDTERTQIHQESAARVQALVANFSRQALFKTTHVRYRGGRSAQPQFSPLQRTLLTSEVTGAPWSDAAASHWRSGNLAKSLIRQRSAMDANVRFATESGFLRARPRALDAAFAFVPQSLLTTLAKRTLISDRLTNRSQFETKLLETKFLETTRFETKRFRRPVFAPTAAAVRNLQSALELILVRKEGASRPPSLDFVFAQPARRKLSEERVVKRLEQREIVELVRKEVKQSMDHGSRGLSFTSFTREDYVEISDQVYATLMKRLTVERERLGWR